MTQPAQLDLTPPTLNVRLYRGDDATIRVTLEDDDGPVVLPTTGWSSQLRVSKDSTDVVDECVIDATSGATGVLFITFPDTATLASGLYYDAQCTTGGLRTWVKGRLTITGDVTRA